MFYMKNRLGAWQVGEESDKGRVEFKLFFPAGFDPKISSIRVAGDFQSRISTHVDWDFQNGFALTKNTTQDGDFWSYRTESELPSDYYQYKYLVTFNNGSARIVSDPCARYGGIDHQNAAFVIGGSSPADNLVAPLPNGRKHLRDLIIYELMIDDFTDDYRETKAPLAAVIDKLDYLKNLGFNAILFMPWTAWKNRDYDWGYEPFQYFAVEYRYANQAGRPAEKISWLKKLVAACHERDIHVIMDGVFNHVSVDFPYKHFYHNPDDCPYTGDYGGGFPGLQDLNFHQECTNQFIRDVCFYWIDTFKIDGIRFDNTVNYYVAGNPNGLARLMDDIEGHMAAKGEHNFSLTLEHLNIEAVAITRKTKATSYWDNALHQCAFDALWHNRITSNLLNALNNQRWLDNAAKVPTIYLSNHDHSHAAWQAGAKENLGGMKWYKTQPYVIALYTSPATPMIQNGQEFGEDHWIMENDQNTGRRISPRPIRWKLADDGIGAALRRLYGRLAAIRLQYPGLRSPNFYPQPWDEWQTRFDPQGYGLDLSKQVAIFRRWGDDDHGRQQRFVIVLNFSDSNQWASVPFPENGEWRDLLSGDDDTRSVQVEGGRLDLEISSNWGYVFFR